MPELPEVETVRRTLLEKIVGRTIRSVEIFMPKIVVSPSGEDFTQTVTGLTIKDINRRGKYLILPLAGGYALVIHLRMTGKLLYCPANSEVVKHTHVIFNLDDGNQLRFVDQRQFGNITLVTENGLDQISGLAKMGPEPLEAGFTKGKFKTALGNRNTKIKPLLLDQTFLAGLGNIYVDEALFRAKVHPERPAKTLKPAEIDKLYIAIREVLQEGIENRGTSIKDYVDGEGKAGGFQNRLKAYGRENMPCEHCGTLLARIKVGGRSSVYCPRCQKVT